MSEKMQRKDAREWVRKLATAWFAYDCGSQEFDKMFREAAQSVGLTIPEPPEPPLADRIGNIVNTIRSETDDSLPIGIYPYMVAAAELLNLACEAARPSSESR